MKLNWRRMMMGMAFVGLIGMSLPSCVIRARGKAKVVWVVDERPPDPAPRYESRPSKTGHVWVKGNWEWRNGKWNWKRGRYVAVKQQHTWKAGYWEQRGNRWHWVKGYWIKGDVNVRDHRDHGGGGGDVNVRDHRQKKRPKYGASRCAAGANAPGNTYVWVCGHWDWNESSWEWSWKAGHWERSRAEADWHWKAGYWVESGGTWTFHAGAWVKGRGQSDVKVQVRDHRKKSEKKDSGTDNERVPAKRGKSAN
jgi:hypothetical protein